MKMGIPLTLMALILLVIFWFTYWKWLGMVQRFPSARPCSSGGMPCLI